MRQQVFEFLRLGLPRFDGQFEMPPERRWHPFRGGIQIPDPLGKRAHSTLRAILFSLPPLCLRHAASQAAEPSNSSGVRYPRYECSLRRL